MLHAFKLGPLESDEGPFGMYFAVGDEGAAGPVEAHDDLDGFKRLKATTSHELVLAPEHAQVAATLGVKTARLPETVATLRATFGLQTFWGSRLGPQSLGVVPRFIKAALDYDEAAPWDCFVGEETVRLEVSGPGPHPVEASVLGAAGEQFGLSLYLQAGAIERLIATPRSDEFPLSEAISVLFSDGPDWLADVLEPVTGSRLVPDVILFEKGVEAEPRAQHFELLIAAMDAVVALCESEDETGTARHGPITVRALGPDYSATASAPAPAREVGRNEPCPCGSGKKHKRCCLGTQAAASNGRVPGSSTLHDVDSQVVLDCLQHLARLDRGGPKRHFSENGLEGLSEQLAVPLALYQFPFGGKTPAQHYREARGDRLDPRQARWIDAALRSRLSVWEVLDADPGRSLQLHDLLTGERREVHEVSGSRGIAMRDAVLACVVDCEGGSVLGGIHPSPLRAADVNRMIEQLEAQGALASDRAPAERTRTLLAAWEKALRERAERPKGKITNTDTEPLRLIDDSWEVVKGKMQAVLTALVALPGTQLEADSRKEARLAFIRKGNAIHPTWKATVLGTAQLNAKSLRLSSNSVERADRLRAEVERAAGGWLKAVRRTAEEVKPPPGIAEDVAVDAQPLPAHLVGFASDTDTLERDWLDLGSVSLGGKTPREAAADAGPRVRLHRLLSERENAALRGGRQDRAQALQLRRELGLDEVGGLRPDAANDRALGAGRKISMTLLDLAYPLFEQEAQDADAALIEHWVRFAAQVWNAAVDDEEGGSSANIGALKRELSKRRGPPHPEWVDLLLERRRRRFAGDMRLINVREAGLKKGRFNVIAEGRLSPATAQRVGWKPGR